MACRFTFEVDEERGRAILKLNGREVTHSSNNWDGKLAQEDGNPRKWQFRYSISVNAANSGCQ